MKFIKDLFVNLSLILSLLFFFSCGEDNPPANQITSTDFEKGIFFVSYNETAVNISIATNNPAKFYPNTSKNSFAIEESGKATLRLDQGVYWIDVVWENGVPLRETIPVYVTRNKDEAIKTVTAIKGMSIDFSGYVLVFRHTNASVGVDIVDSPVAQWWKSCDPGVARQLNDVGKANAKKIGDVIKKFRIPIAGAISSEFCRAFQTFEYMDLGLQIALDRRLNHENESNKLAMWADVFQTIKGNPKTNGVLMLVGHYNMYDQNPYRSSIRPFNQSDGFLMKLRTSGDLEFIGSVPMAMWDLFL
jgi:phosphohistidine phosphatase SixA